MILLEITVNVTQSGPVYLIIENPGVPSRVWLAVGTEEEENMVEAGEASSTEVEYWYDAGTFATSYCGSSIPISSSPSVCISSPPNTYSVDVEDTAASRVISACYFNAVNLELRL